MGRPRAHADEHAERLNEAFALLTELSSAAVVHALEESHAISERQARRYVSAAQKLGEEIPVPERTTVFTVRLPQSLIARVRESARMSEESVSATVGRALSSGLTEGHGPGRGTAC